MIVREHQYNMCGIKFRMSSTTGTSFSNCRSFSRISLSLLFTLIVILWLFAELLLLLLVFEICKVLLSLASGGNLSLNLSLSLSLKLPTRSLLLLLLVWSVLFWAVELLTTGAEDKRLCGFNNTAAPWNSRLEKDIDMDDENEDDASVRPLLLLESTTGTP